jgi:para-aminobenzoate synthetase/4-amino-4-deoxychorismate lyase
MAFRVLAAQTPNAILLETAKQDGASDRSLLFLNPTANLVAETARDVDRLLGEIDHQLANGSFVAGFFSYEYGEHLAGLPPRQSDNLSPDEPLARLGVFGAPIEFDHSSGVIRGSLPTTQIVDSVQHEPALISTDGLRISRHDYNAALERIHEYLQAGDTYQVNFTDKVDGHTTSGPLAVYETLLQQQPVSFAAFLNDPTGPLLSFSPELFYRTAQGRIEVRPMKGTWPRGRDLTEDKAAERQLQTDEKNRSEHVMIVDLLRNDLGRICKYGSIEVDKLFHVERYNTLFQMTSTSSGLLRDEVSSAQVFANLFPSGSITGAPKRRTMEIIRELESQPRGVYTGSVGYFAPGGEACFNVAIRTMKLRGEHLTMGVGGGITADSKPEEEFEECRLKSAFLTKRRPPFSLIETMCCNGGIAMLPLHMQRLSNSARYFGIRYNDDRLLSDLASAAMSCGIVESKIRLEINEDGRWIITTSPLEPTRWRGRLLLAEERMNSLNVFLSHKTTNRGAYERNFVAAHQLSFDEVLFLNEHAQLTEGAISNVFLKKDGRWATPSLGCGVLPGVKRTQMLEELHNVEEGELQISDLAGADSIFVCNALRGVRQVLSVETIDGIVIWRHNADILS